MQVLTKLLSGLVDMLLSIVNGLIVGTVTFVVNLLDGLDSSDSLVNLGKLLFPFLPPEWIAIVEVSLIVLVVGLIIRKKVIGS